MKNEAVIKVLKIFTSSPMIGHKDDEYIRALAVTEYEIQDQNISLSEWRNITAFLILHGYIKTISEKEFKERHESFFNRIGFTEEKIKNLTKEEREETADLLIKQGKEVYGIDLEKESYNTSLFPMDIKSNEEFKTNRVEEKVIKSSVLGYFFIEKDISLLLDILEKGVDYNEIDHKRFPVKLSFNNEKSILYILGYKPIQIKKHTSKITTREHSLLKYIFESRNISKKFYYWELQENSIYDDNLSEEDYIQIVKDVNKKIEESIKIKEKFIKYNREFFQINQYFL